MVNINMELPDELHRELKVQAALSETTLKELITEALEDTCPYIRGFDPEIPDEITIIADDLDAIPVRAEINVSLHNTHTQVSAKLKLRSYLAHTATYDLDLTNQGYEIPDQLWSEAMDRLFPKEQV